MLKSLLSTLLIFVLLFSAFGKTKTKKCPVRIPDSLVSLYMKSDLVIIGDVKSEKVEKTLSISDSYTTTLIKKTIQVSKTLKGLPSPNVALYQTNYVYKQGENEINEFAINDGEEIINYKVGDKAIFFLKKDENAQLRATDYNGIKILNDADLSIYEKRIKELNAIVKLKKNQAENFAEWLVKCAEEPATHWEGVYELNRSFNILDYEKEEAEEAAKEAKDNESNNEEVKDEEVVEMFSKNSFTNTSEIAKVLTDSQKERLTTIFFNSVNQKLYAQTNDSMPDNWELVRLISNWDKQRIILYVYSQLQNAHSNNAENATYLMSTLCNIIEDNELYEFYRSYQDSLSFKDTDIINDEKSESENNSTVITDEPELKNKKDVKEKITAQDYRKNVYNNFVSRYEKLASQNFVKIQEEEFDERKDTSNVVLGGEDVNK